MRQSYVAVVGRTVKYGLPERLKNNAVESAPAFVRAVKNGCSLELEGLAPGRGEILLSGGVPARVAVFAEKEAFLAPVISCNYHEGWFPGIQNEVGHPRCCGPDMHGNAFNYARRLADVIHGAGLPVTWLADGYTWRNDTETLEEYCRAGDELGFMPPSRSHFNTGNYNLFLSEKETFKIMEGQLAFLRNLSGKNIRTAGIDQFIGAIGTNILRAMTKLGMRALWGIGFDHRECDTSMYHYGCPWNPYKPSLKNFRIPGRENTAPWIFDWTYRDLVNTVHVPGVNSGAVYFSTDVDDIYNCRIAYHQPDYYNRIAENLLANVPDNDFAVMVVHQEDHDSGDGERNAYLGRFFESRPPLTAATLGEIADWLDIKYPGKAEPCKSLYLEDPLDCHDKVYFYSGSTPKPADWPEKGKYPPVCAYYDADTQVIFERGSHAPFRYFDYSKQEEVAEDSFCSPEELPEIRALSIKEDPAGFTVALEASADCPKYPFAVWTERPVPRGAIRLRGGFAAFVSLVKGANEIRIDCGERV
ncbi:MAG: hypothetical protein ILO36_05800 [Abditibacteriota bacterium]|nr:hypothetical protein [Abditibacteriota bacterium]